MFSYFEKIKLFFKKNDSLLFILLIVLIGTIASRSLFLSGFYSSHDGVSHVIRLVKFHEGLMDEQIIPKWSKGLAFGFGSPVLLFYGQLPYLVGLIPKIIGFSFASSIEIIFGLSLVISGLTFYLWAKEIFGKNAAFIGALLYIWAPYRFLDIYVRGAYPESFAFIFPPLILLSLYKIFYKSEKKGFILATLSLSGLILSHNVMALFFIPIYIFYALGLFLIRKNKKKMTISGISLLFSLLMTSFYWTPAFFEKKFVNLNNLDASSGFTSNFVGLREIIYSKWAWGPLGSTSPMSLQIGLVQQGMVVIGAIVFFIFLLRKKRIIKSLEQLFKRVGLNFPNKIDKLHLLHFLLFFFLFIISIFLMTQKSQVLWKSVPLLSFVLYPWRFLVIIVFSSAVLSVFVVEVLKPKIFYLLIITLLALYANRNYSQLVGKVYENDSYYENYQNTADMWGEFLPVTSDLEVIKKCRLEGCIFEKVVVPSMTDIEIVTNKNNLLVFSYESQKDFKATINTYYFPGWKAYLDDSFSNEVIKVNEIGTMDIDLPKGNHIFKLKFENTKIRNFSLFISLFGLVSSGIYLLCIKKH